jgi:hypothetical protein
MHDHHSRNHIIIGRGDIRICHRRSTLVGARTGVVSGPYGAFLPDGTWPRLTRRCTMLDPTGALVIEDAVLADRIAAMVVGVPGLRLVGPAEAADASRGPLHRRLGVGRPQCLACWSRRSRAWSCSSLAKLSAPFHRTAVNSNVQSLVPLRLSEPRYRHMRALDRAAFLGARERELGSPAKA